MLSSFSSLLPPSVQDQLSKVGGAHRDHQPLVRIDDEDGYSDGNKSDAMAGADEMGVKKRGKKDKSANETFIVVRPPPSKSNHPLNLQVQLVPPNSRGVPDRSSTAGSRQSVDFPAASVTSSPTSEGPFQQQQEENLRENLSRTSSVQSDTSTSYSYSNSVSSFASTTSTSSGRRMIIPLYNLQAHNVMTNLVVDAGTDAKIAKFMKRGMEMIGLAVLEPFEVYGSSSNTLSSHVGQTGSIRSTHLQPPHPSSRPDTPEQSQIPASNISEDSHHPQNPSISLTPADPLPTGPTPTSGKRIFGKFFSKKRDSTSNASLTPTIAHTRAESAPSSPSTPIPQPPTTPTRHSKRLSASFSKSPSTTTPTTATIPPPASATLGQLVLGIQPSISLPSRKEKSSRPTMYVWVVRKWLKVPGGESLLGGLVGKLGGGKDGSGLKDALGLGGGNVIGGMVEVRFEWKRGKRKEGRNGRRKLSVGAAAGRKLSTGSMSGSVNGAGKANSVSGSNAPSTTSLQGQKTERGGSPRRRPPQPGSAERKMSNRLSAISISQQSTSTSITSEGGGEREDREDDVDEGEESDPEDSETPWSCTLKIRRLNATTPARTPVDSHGSGRRGQDKDKGVDLRLKIALLSPTPHHPKVVGLLKVPFPLPDVEVEKAELKPRISGTDGGPAAGAGAGGASDGLVLTAEEIKDVVSSTGLWLVVREGFGGVGKVSRKGDGWRIRG